MAKFTVSGIQFELTREEVEKKLRSIVPESVRELFVEINGDQFPIKQALAVTAGLQRGMFTSHDAMRVFRKLNVPIGPDQLTLVGRFFAVLKSLNEFDKIEVQGVLAAQISRNPREECVFGLYLRGRANVQSLLSLKQAIDVQAIVMIARNLFELATDVKLLHVVPNGVEKFAAFSQVEKLRAAEKVIAYKIGHPNSRVDASIQEQFVAVNKVTINKRRLELWPETQAKKGSPNGKPLRHWSGMTMKERSAKLGSPYDEIYELKYPQMSWYAHSAGLTGFDLKRETYFVLAGTYFELAAMCYKDMLISVIDEFQLSVADEKIKNKMRLAHVMPFTDTDEELQALGRELLG